MTPPGEPRDAWAYRLAIGGVGLALVAFLIGGAIIGASGHAKEMVKEYWTIGAALSGALVGILVPSPRQRRAGKVEAQAAAAATATGANALEEARNFAVATTEALADAHVAQSAAVKRGEAAGKEVVTAAEQAAATRAGAIATSLESAILSMLDLLLLFGVIAGSLWLASEVNATDAALLRTIAAAAAGAILGLLSPSPIKTGPAQRG
jgi:hypothetical protein